MRYTYTDEDIEFLRINYPIGNWEAIQERFKLSTKAPIYKKCLRLGIASKNTHRLYFDNSSQRRRWNNKEIDILCENYSKLPLENLYDLLPGRNKNMIVNKARQLGLKSYHRESMIWKKEEIDYIIHNWELTPDKVMASILKRTFRAVKAKREELRLYRQNADDKSYPNLSKYLRGQNQKWKKDSMNVCQYQCVLTGSKNFEIHHLYGVSNIINDIFNEYPNYKDLNFDDYTEEDLNFLLGKFLEKQNQFPLGVCVEKRLHILFHSLYGQYYNTPEQWYRFCEDYKKGNYSKYI